MSLSTLVKRCLECALVLGSVLVLLLLRGAAAFGQSQQVDTSETPDFRFSIDWNSNAGIYLYAPQKWGELRISLKNAGDRPRELLCATSFEADPGLQYARRIWLPAQSSLRVKHPVLIPGCDSTDHIVNLSPSSLVFDVSSSSEVLLKSEGGLLRHDGTLAVTNDTRITAVIGDSSIASKESMNEIADLLAAGRVDQQLTNTFTVLLDSFLPCDADGLDAMDHIVIADDRIADDLAALSAIRQWLHAGGHLWVMLDRVSPDVLEILLGDSFNGHVVDRIGLTSVRVDQAPVMSDKEGAQGQPVQHDEPVDLVRMIISDVDVSYLVNGWPAAMTKSYGNGKLLITTLGPRGWIRTPPATAVPSSDRLRTSEFMPTVEMSLIVDDFFRVRKPELLPASDIEPQVREYVGYSVLSWWLVVGLLLGFAAVIVFVGFWLLRSDLLQHLGWIGSILAIVVSLLLMLSGRMNRHGIPATVASVQVMQSINGTDEARSEGMLAVYQPEGSKVPVAATQGGRLVPGMSGLESTTRRMVTTDLGVYYWENVPQSAGLRVTPFRHSEAFPERLEVRATFDANGLIGKYTGSVPPGADAMIATRSGRMGVTLASDGTFVGRSDSVFEANQFLSAGLINDEQGRRQRTLSALLTNPQRMDYPDHPQLMFWSEPRNNGFQFGEELTMQGATLVAVPLAIDRPENGENIIIPSPLLSYAVRRNPDGTLPSAMWDAARREWQERSSPGLNWLSFQIPRELLPLAAKKARLDFRVNGPVGKIDVFGLKNGEVTKLETIMDPVGSVSVEIDDPEVLAIDSEGRLALGISAGDPDRPELTHTVSQGGDAQAGQSEGQTVDLNAKVNYWKIESLAIQLWAITTEPTVKD